MNKMIKKILQWANFDIAPIITNLPVIVFIGTSCVVGGLMIKNVGSLVGPDMAFAHYPSTLAVSTGQFTLDSQPAENGYGKYNTMYGKERYIISGRDGCVRDQLVSATIGPSLPWVSDDLMTCIESHDAKLSADKEVKSGINMQYPFISYLPQSIGMTMGMNAGYSPAKSQILARITNLLVYILLIATAIYIIPKGKWLFVLLATIPTSLFLASSLSADSLSIAWSFLFVAYILNLYVKPKILSRRQLTILAVMGIMLFLLKVAYAPLILLILTLKERHISYSKKWLLFISASIIGVILYLIWSTHWTGLSSLVDISAQKDLILQNLPKVAVGVIVQVIHVPFMLFEIGGFIYILIAEAVLAMVIFAIYNTKDKMPIRRFVDFIIDYKLQIIGALAAILSLSATFMALLLTWTVISEYGFLDIKGFQGRYTLPILPLLVLFYFLPTKQHGKTLNATKKVIRK